MANNELSTWTGIRALLDRMDRERREPDPWESHLVSRAIVGLRRGEVDPGVLTRAASNCGRRVEPGEMVTREEAALTKADLRSAFLSLRVPGGHPA